MISFPNAKINLGLSILSRRDDGYHNIESCFYPIPYQDILEFIPSKKFHFQSSGLTIDGIVNNNLVVKAYKIMQRDFQLEPVAIHLHKIIPMGAGLGGGSADAAFMLNMMDEYFQLMLGDEYLEVLALELGSDCPFFIKNKPVLARGRGEEFESIKIDLSGKQLVLVTPNIHVSTAQAYALSIPAKPQKPIAEILKQPIKSWKDELVNDFEISVFDKFPELAHIKQLLYDAGAIYASMSGSGATVYGLFEKEVNLDNFKMNHPTKIFVL